MADLWDRVKRTAAEIYNTASEKTVEGVNLGVKHLDLVSIRRELSKEFTGLGGRVYQLIRRGEELALSEDPTVRHHLGRLAELEAKLEEKEQEIKDIRDKDRDDEPPETPDLIEPEPTEAGTGSTASGPDDHR